MSYRSLSLGLCCCLILAALTAGCMPRQSQVAPAEAPVVPVSLPVEREVTDYVDFTGRTDAVKAVDIRARVTGYLEKMLFKEGAEVKKGDLLFEIDHRPYRAQADQAISQVALNEASLKLAQVTYERDRSVAASAPGAISQQQIDQDIAAVNEAVARVNAAKASTEVYTLNLNFTKVTSPIDGQISRYYLTEGNLVNQDQTLLTTVVSLDPMYAYFDMDEPTVLRTRRAINEGRIKRYQSGQVPVFMGMQGEDGFPHRGTLNFSNNQFNPTTGSISVRGVFANPRTLSEVVNCASLLAQARSLSPIWPIGWTADTIARPPLGTRLLSPGMFVRMRLPIGQPHPAQLIIDRAIGSDQGKKFVYVLDADNKAQYRRITTGPLQEDGLRVIGPVRKEGSRVVEGVEPNEWVVVGGLQQVRPRMVVQPERRPMPSMSQTDEEEAADEAKPVQGQKQRQPQGAAPKQ